MFVIGLTGGIGSGKSTVARLFQKYQISVIDADQVARHVVEIGSPTLQKMVEYFGNDIIETNGALNRAALRERIFKTPSERLWLENLLHPLIAQEIQQQLTQAQGPYVILMSPLLLESGQAQWVDRVLVVDVPETIQIERTQQRDQVPSEQIEAIMSSQWTRAQRLAKADDVIENTNAITSLEKKVALLNKKYLALCF